MQVKAAEVDSERKTKPEKRTKLKANQIEPRSGRTGKSQAPNKEQLLLLIIMEKFFGVGRSLGLTR